MVADLPTPGERLDRMVEYSCHILKRTQPIHAIIRGAADKEAFASELGQRLLDERLTNQRERIRRFLSGDLQPGLSIADAADRYCAMTSPELYHLLTVELGWSAERHRRWVGEMLAADLLTPVKARQAPRRRQRSGDSDTSSR